MTSFTLPGSAFGEQAAIVDNVFAPGTAAALGIPLAAAEAALTAALPAPSTITLKPIDTVKFKENDWWTSHEISIQSTDASPFQYIVGFHYYYQQYANPIIFTANQPNLTNPILLGPLAAAGFDPFIPGALTPAAANPHDLLAVSSYQFESQSEAVYGQASYKITDDIKVTANLRYSADQKWGNQEARDIAFGGSATTGLYNLLIPLYERRHAGDRRDIGGRLPIWATALANGANSRNTSAAGLGKGVKSMGVIQPNGNAFRSLSGTDSEVTGGAGIEWTPTPDIFTYARYSRGYAPISFNAFSIGANPEDGAGSPGIPMKVGLQADLRPSAVGRRGGLLLRLRPDSAPAHRRRERDSDQLFHQLSEGQVDRASRSRAFGPRPGT